jgi:hypothetical protein
VLLVPGNQAVAHQVVAEGEEGGVPGRPAAFLARVGFLFLAQSLLFAQALQVLARGLHHGADRASSRT